MPFVKCMPYACGTDKNKHKVPTKMRMSCDNVVQDSGEIKKIITEMSIGRVPMPMTSQTDWTETRLR